MLWFSWGYASFGVGIPVFVGMAALAVGFLFRSHQTVRLGADEILPPRLLQCRQHQLAVLGQVILQQSPLHGFFFRRFRHIDMQVEIVPGVG